MMIEILVALDGMERAGHRVRALALAMRDGRFADRFRRLVRMKLVTADGRISATGRAILKGVDDE
jgi:hypothetical protein